LPTSSEPPFEDWLSESDWAPRSRRNYLVTLTTLLNFALDREYCSGNPASRIERPILDDSAPGILTVKEAETLLQTAVNGVPDKLDPKPQMVAGIAIGLFAGLRRSEICTLDWSEVSLDDRYIEIKAAKAKTRQRRLVTIGDNLAAWLKPYVKVEGRVAPSANQDVFGEHLKDIAQASGITEWPHNAMRHSFGSYFYAKTKEENRTAAEMGNSPAVVFKHYRAIVRNGDENKYWAIMP
jgi:site-specific recombinase XerD